MRPSTISAFALGMCAAVVAIAVGWAFAGNGAEHLPACQTSMHEVTP